MQPSRHALPVSSRCMSVALLLITALPTCTCPFSSLVDIKVVRPVASAISHSFRHPSVTVAAGSDLELTCWSPQSPVAWNGSDSSSLRLPNVGSRTVSLYSCCEASSSPRHCSSIHVFVKGTNHLISRSR